MSKAKKPWSGRFKEPTHRSVEEFTASITFDKRLYAYDIEGSIAHCRMLRRQGIISSLDEKAIISGLKDIGRDIEKGKFKFSVSDEDIHMAVERELTKRTGSRGAKLHTARSRNDQVALDLRLYLRDEAKAVVELLDALQAVLVNMAKEEIGSVMPGYTHLQRAQPVLLSHYLLAFWEMFERDRMRFHDTLGRIDVMPLGAAALAGTGIPIDRSYVAQQLGFQKITTNSMDSVSDRDFAAEFLFNSSLVMMHMSRFCEDLVVWSSSEFGFVEIPDSFTTGSSIMPQKKNPDVAELIRGKTGRVYGNLVALLTVLKGLPMTYNRDLQEDKEPVFDTADTLKSCLRILAEMISRIKFHREKLLEASGGFSTATDIAEYLVTRGVPFRSAHEIVGRIVSYCIEQGKGLDQLTGPELEKFHPELAVGIGALVNPGESVNRKNVKGGTAKRAVLSRIRAIEKSK